MELKNIELRTRGGGITMGYWKHSFSYLFYEIDIRKSHDKIFDLICFFLLIDSNVFFNELFFRTLLNLIVSGISYCMYLTNHI